MRHALKVLLAGHPGQTLTQVETLLAEQRQLLVTTRPVNTGETLPLSDLQASCDAIVLVVGEDWRSTLEACFQPGTMANKPLLVVGLPGDLELLRMSMRIGARDFFSIPVSATDLIPALDRVATEEYERRGALSARVTTFMNAKGGSGASFCAANFAHILAKGQGRRTVLLDFELQFGSLPTYFNLQSRNGLVRALELVDTLDATALQGYTQQHPSGLYLLAAAAEGMVLPEDIHEERVAKLFAVLDDAYEELVIDLPRRIDRATAAVLDRSDLVMLVVQQTVAHLHELKRLAALLRGEVGVASHRLIVVINRFEKRGEVTLKDFTEALPGLRVETLPNDYRRVADSINLGIPLLEQAPGSPLCKALKGLVESLSFPGAPRVPQARGPWSWLAGKHT
ncbi:AAA family ATPase [uncultured Thiodictyon sp.]|jgi:pilus assembly protein CpaE|uniref:nucleotide-binding protein n=1 Tax=uncultured Thiodictyon sp. TaxID=1846217 RepID=UPI0025F77025|nr:AAA family ATPase [uncultured Thiodictyon sp.]